MKVIGLEIGGKNGFIDVIVRVYEFDDWYTIT